MYPVVACLVYVYNFIAFDMYQSISNLCEDEGVI